MEDVPWHYLNNGGEGHPVKMKNGQGILDMQGGVWDWCRDGSGSDSSGIQTNPLVLAVEFFACFEVAVGPT